MEIRIGDYYVNKTWRFLLPLLRGHGDLFVKNFNPLFKLAVGVHDTLLDGSKISKEKSIYIMFDKKFNEFAFITFLEWVKEQDYYLTDYCPDADILESQKHMLVLKIPTIFLEAYDYFLNGNYSLMFLEKELDFLFSDKTKKDERDVLVRNPEIREDFCKKVNEEFFTNLTKEDFVMSELELPLKKSEEIFNYTQISKNIYIKINNKYEK